ncbi:unnamed protein product [Linum tenue]|nr:unnamed protein product [Linum tenue]
MAYAISEADAAKAPRVTDGEDTYVHKMLLKGTTYYLYVHRSSSSSLRSSIMSSIYSSSEALETSISDSKIFLAYDTCSYLHYGLLAARAEILKVSDGSSNPCVLGGYDGTVNCFVIGKIHSLDFMSYQDTVIKISFLNRKYLCLPMISDWDDERCGNQEFNSSCFSMIET